jgi:hypothetical protein
MIFIQGLQVFIWHRPRALRLNKGHLFKSFISYFFSVTWRITRSQFRPSIFLIR